MGNKFIYRLLFFLFIFIISIIFPVCALANFRFASIADGHVETSNFTSTINQIKTFSPSLIIFSGDVENDGVVSNELDPMINVLKNTGVFNSTFIVRGNHDDHLSNSASLWQNYFTLAARTMPAGVTNYVGINSNSTYLTYSFDYDNSRFIGVDVPGDIDLLTSAQYTFLNARLSDAENLGLTHAFIFFHGPEYCVSDTHCSCSTKTGSCTPSAFVSMVNNHPIVSATFHGHEHVLAHVHMDNTRVPTLTRPYEEFFTSSAGNPYNFTVYPGRVDNDYTSHSLRSFATIDVSGPSFTVNFYRTGTTTSLWSKTFTKSTVIASPSPSPSPSPSVKPGDANGDTKVDGIDYVVWLNHYNQSTSNKQLDGDYNNSGIVDGVDYVIWMNNYGK